MSKLIIFLGVVIFSIVLSIIAINIQEMVSTIGATTTQYSVPQEIIFLLLSGMVCLYLLYCTRGSGIGKV